MSILLFDISHVILAIRLSRVKFILLKIIFDTENITKGIDLHFGVSHWVFWV